MTKPADFEALAWLFEDLRPSMVKSTQINSPAGGQAVARRDLRD
jgi:hypothetical protein